MRRLTCLLTATLLAAAAAPVAAWDDHARIRRLALEGVPELAALPPVTVTPLTFEVQGINPATTFDHVGAAPGETQTPLDILATYAQEPDWGMDQELRVSWQQRFMGGYTGLGSQGYFHMYYPSLTIHLPVPVMSMGAAPKRATQWREMARAAFESGDEYWGWRFTAWSLHYIEDLAQPYHSTQTHRRFIQLGSPIQGTTNCTANFHLLYEHWVARRLQAEDQGGTNFGLRAALTAGEPVSTSAISKLAKKVARRSHKGFGGVAGQCIAYFGERFLSKERVEPTSAELDKVEPGPVLDALMETTRRYLSLAGGALRGAVAEVLAERAAADEFVAE